MYTSTTPLLQFTPIFPATSPLYSSILRSDRLGLLARIIAVLLLHLLDELDVFLLGLGGGDAIGDELLPRFILVFALLCAVSMKREAEKKGGRRRVAARGIGLVGEGAKRYGGDGKAFGVCWTVP